MKNPISVFFDSNQELHIYCGTNRSKSLFITQLKIQSMNKHTQKKIQNEESENEFLQTISNLIKINRENSEKIFSLNEEINKLKNKISNLESSIVRIENNQ